MNQRFRKVDAILATTCDVDTSKLTNCVRYVHERDRCIDRNACCSSGNACEEGHTSENVISTTRPLLNHVVISTKVPMIGTEKDRSVVLQSGCLNALQEFTKDPISIRNHAQICRLDAVEEIRVQRSQIAIEWDSSVLRVVFRLLCVVRR